MRTDNSAAKYPGRTRSGATFRAHRFAVINPGLKPWAKFCCPFGAVARLRRITSLPIKIFPHDFLIAGTAKTIIIEERLAIPKPEA
jgi:hypothetical protein